MYREQVRVISPAREWYEAECQDCAWAGEYLDTGRERTNFADESAALGSAEYHSRARRHVVTVWRVVAELPLTADTGRE